MLVYISPRIENFFIKTVLNQYKFRLFYRNKSFLKLKESKI